ncbi:hypothetical protein KZJ38_17140 [Paraburkholderia edwinii]|uniref:Uncharacterized protein n=1 Tax=Paraburkholderia edwinii TaxID=2861782 RepID=A0ABX8UGW2_9BURK|nr:hypothetical protein [Paraburkholderia edwinii]QYD67999.1 hypothetical protein KZJ38_17140 [Paraburkholderia edwinii]
MASMTRCMCHLNDDMNVLFAPSAAGRLVEPAAASAMANVNASVTAQTLNRRKKPDFIEVLG